MSAYRSEPGSRSAVKTELTSARLNWPDYQSGELACHAPLTGMLQVSRHPRSPVAHF